MRKSTIGLSIALLLSLSVTVWVWVQWDAARSRSAELQARVAGLEHDLLTQTPDQASPSAAANSAAAVPHTGNGAVASTPQKLAKEAPGAQAKEWLAQQQRLMQDPQYQSALVKQQRAFISMTFRELPTALHLDAAQTARVFDALAEQAVHRMYGGSESQRLADDARLTELLGDDGGRRLQEFRDAVPSRAETGMLRSTLAEAGQPLRDDQFDPLVAIVRREQQRFDQDLKDHEARDPPTGYDSEASRLRIETNDRILEASKTLLSASQVAALESYYSTQRQISEAMSAAMTLQFELGIRDAQTRQVREAQGNRSN